MKTYTIKFELISETGYHTEIIFDECYEIFLTDTRFEFTDLIAGYRYNYYLKDISETQSAKKIYNIRIIENGNDNE